jgi:hypothetical protein
MSDLLILPPYSLIINRQTGLLQAGATVVFEGKNEQLYGKRRREIKRATD